MPSRSAPGSRSALEALDAALNAHDLEGALALFSEDAVVRYEPAPPAPARAVYAGQEAIRSLLEGLIRRDVAVAAEGYAAEGERALSRGRCVYAAGHEALGGNPVGLEGEALVEGGRIRALTFTFTPECIARIRAAVTARR